MDNKTRQWLGGFTNKKFLLKMGTVAGFGATIVFLAKGQMKADAILAESNQIKNAEPKYDSEGNQLLVLPGRKEVFDLTWPCYVPAAVSAVITALCYILQQKLTAAEIATLSASLTAVAANRQQILEVVREKFGDEVVDEVMSIVRFEKPALSKMPPAELVEAGSKKKYKYPAEPTGRGDLLFIDEWSGRKFRSSIEAVKLAQEKFNEILIHGDSGIEGVGNYNSYNYLFELYGVDDRGYCGEIGWWYDPKTKDGNVDEDGVIFEMTEPKYVEKYGEEVVYIDIVRTPPFQGFMEEG